MTKLKGCRDSHSIRVEFSATCAELGAAKDRIYTLEESCTKFHRRLLELRLELEESEKQEAAIKAAGEVKDEPVSTQEA